MRLLIIEDENKTAAHLQKGLSENGFTVKVACDGSESSRLARAGGYALIVLDVMLPRQDGWAILDEMRRAGITSSSSSFLFSKFASGHRDKAKTSRPCVSFWKVSHKNQSGKLQFHQFRSSFRILAFLTRRSAVTIAEKGGGILAMIWNTASSNT